MCFYFSLSLFIVSIKKFYYVFKALLEYIVVKVADRNGSLKISKLKDGCY